MPGSLFVTQRAYLHSRLFVSGINVVTPLILFALLFHYNKASNVNINVMKDVSNYLHIKY